MQNLAQNFRFFVKTKNAVPMKNNGFRTTLKTGKTYDIHSRKVLARRAIPKGRVSFQKLSVIALSDPCVNTGKTCHLDENGCGKAKRAHS